MQHGFMTELVFDDQKYMNAVPKRPSVPVARIEKASEVNALHRQIELAAVLAEVVAGRLRHSQFDE